MYYPAADFSKKLNQTTDERTGWLKFERMYSSPSKLTMLNTQRIAAKHRISYVLRSPMHTPISKLCVY
jgi:hypothetical protein